MTDFILGASTVACLAIALFFFRFWRESNDRLFAAFAGAFLVFGVNRLILALTSEDNDGRIYSYTLRFFAFMLVVWGIVDKNRAAGEVPRGGGQRAEMGGDTHFQAPG